MKCDPQDWEIMKQYSWFLDSNGYARTSINGKHPSFHRMILEIGDKDIQIDHINKDKIDNRRSNLRICNNQKNSFNKRKYITNTSGYKGVYFDKDRNKWRASIMIDGKSYKSPKRYNTPSEAYEWYMMMSDKLFEEYSVFESDKIASKAMEIIETNVG